MSCILDDHLARQCTHCAHVCAGGLLQEEVKILLRIGEGAFGEVSLATCTIFGSVAIKWLKVRCYPP